MKKLYYVSGLVMSMFLLFGFVVEASEETTTAETTTTTEEVAEVIEDELSNAGIKPGSFFYGLDKFFENIALKLAFSDEAKAEKYSRNAEERLAELNELDENAALIYADELFDEYGLNIEKAHIYVQKLVSEGKISEEKLVKLEKRVEKAESRQEKLSKKANGKISDEMKEKVNETIINAKMAIFTKFADLEATKLLHDEGYGYGQLLKLQAIASISNKTIEELLLIENVVIINEDEEKDINLELLLETLDISKEDLRDDLKTIKDDAKVTMKEKMDSVNSRGNKAKGNGKK